MKNKLFTMLLSILTILLVEQNTQAQGHAYLSKTQIKKGVNIDTADLVKALLANDQTVLAEDKDEFLKDYCEILTKTLHYSTPLEKGNIIWMFQHALILSIPAGSEVTTCSKNNDGTYTKMVRPAYPGEEAMYYPDNSNVYKPIGSTMCGNPIFSIYTLGAVPPQNKPLASDTTQNSNRYSGSNSNNGSGNYTGGYPGNVTFNTYYSGSGTPTQTQSAPAQSAFQNTYTGNWPGVSPTAFYTPSYQGCNTGYYGGQYNAPSLQLGFGISWGYTWQPNCQMGGYGQNGQPIYIYNTNTNSNYNYNYNNNNNSYNNPNTNGNGTGSWVTPVNGTTNNTNTGSWNTPSNKSLLVSPKMSKMAIVTPK